MPTEDRRARDLTLPTLVAILLLALLARLWHIERESFWADEGWTVLVLAKGPTLPDVVRSMADDQHPPLYFALAHMWIALFGSSEIMTRLLSAFWSLLGVAVVYRLGADVFSRGAGLAAALLLALTDNDIMLAREVRHYAQMAMLGALASLFYLRYLRRPTRTNGIGWLLSATALMYTHYLGALLLAAQGLHTLSLLCARPVRRTADALLRLALVGAAWLPWAVVFLGQSLIRYTRPDLYQSTVPNTPETFAMVRSDLIGSQFALTGGLLLLGLVYITYQNGVPRFRLRPLLPTLYLALWLVVPIAALVGINTRFPILTTRNFLLVTPVIAVLIGHGLMNLERTARIFALSALVITMLFTLDAYHLKPPWRQVTQDVLRYREDSEPILMDVWVEDFSLRYHIGRALGADPETLPMLSLRQWRDAYRENFFAYLLEYLRDKRAFWLVYLGTNDYGLFDFATQQGFTRTAVQLEMHYQDEIFIYRYERVGAQTLAQFGDVLALKRAQLNAPMLRPDEALRVNLLWQALAQPSVDYSVSVFALNEAGVLVAQHDSAPFDGRAPTSAWKPGELHFDSHTLPQLSPGTYTVGVKVYWYADPKPLQVADSPNPEFLVIGTIIIR